MISTAKKWKMTLVVTLFMLFVAIVIAEPTDKEKEDSVILLDNGCGGAEYCHQTYEVCNLYNERLSLGDLTNFNIYFQDGSSGLTKAVSQDKASLESSINQDIALGRYTVKNLYIETLAGNTTKKIYDHYTFKIQERYNQSTGKTDLFDVVDEIINKDELVKVWQKKELKDISIEPLDCIEINLNGKVTGRVDLILELKGYVAARYAWWDSSNPWISESPPDATSCDGSWNGGYPCSNTWDGNWDTNGRNGGSVGYAYYNYTKFWGANQSSLWEVSGQEQRNNLSIPFACWDYDNQTIALKAESYPSQTKYWCHNSTDWTLLQQQGTGGIIYEQKVWWNGNNLGNSTQIEGLKNLTVTSASAIINWSTANDVNGTVCYGTGSYNTCTGHKTLSTNHSVILKSLSANTTYIYNVTSCVEKPALNCSSQNSSFKTLEPTPYKLYLNYTSADFNNNPSDVICFVLLRGKICFNENGFVTV